MSFFKIHDLNTTYKSRNLEQKDYIKSVRLTYMRLKNTKSEMFIFFFSMQPIEI